MEEVPTEETLEGTIERIVYQDPESQWTVARVQLDQMLRPTASARRPAKPASSGQSGGW